MVNQAFIIIIAYRPTRRRRKIPGIGRYPMGPTKRLTYDNFTAHIVDSKYVYRGHSEMLFFTQRPKIVCSISVQQFVVCAIFFTLTNHG